MIPYQAETVYYVPGPQADTLPISHWLQPISRTPSFGSIRFKFRNDVLILKVESGVRVRVDRQHIQVEGAAIYRWIVALELLLDGSITVDELCDKFDKETSLQVRSLIHFLSEAGVLRLANTEGHSLLTPEVLETFKGYLQLLDHICDTPLQSFDTVRKSKVLIVGNGRAMDRATASLLRCGVGSLCLLPDSDPELYPLMTCEEELLKSRGIQVSVTRLRDTVPSLPRSYSLVLYCANVLNIQAARYLGKWCCDHMVTFLPMIVGGDRGLLGPVVMPSAPGCWMCGIKRAGSCLDWSESEGNLIRSFSVPHATHASLSDQVGRDIAFEAFKFLCSSSRLQTQDQMLAYTSKDGRPSPITVLSHSLLACTTSCVQVMNR